MSPAENVAKAADRVQQFSFVGLIDLATQPRDRDIDNIVERRGPYCRVPDITREHLSRHDTAAVAHEVFEQIELLDGQFDILRSPGDLVRDEIHLEILML